VTVVWVEEQRAAERATAVERGLEAVKARQAETEVGLRTSLAETLESERSILASERTALESAQKALEAKQRALEVERKAQSKADQEVLVLWGRVMGTEDTSARLCGQVA